MIQTFTDNARSAGLSSVIAPVRPTLKERYPLIAIERYMEWRRDDGTESMTIRAPAVEWEEWTGMRFPDDGEYIFPGGLATLTVVDGIGTHIDRTSGCYTASTSRQGA